MKTLRLFLYFCVGVLLGGYAVFSYAETMTPTSVQMWGINNYQGVSTADTKEMACTKWLAWRGASYIYEGIYDGGSLGDCKYHTSSDPSWHQIQGIVKVGSPVATCDVSLGWSLSGAVCTRPDCTADQDRNASGVCIPKCADGQIRAEDGVTCRPVCWGAQFYDEINNICKCAYKPPETVSYVVSEANAKAQKLTPPTCSNGCYQRPSGYLLSCPGGVITMFIGGNTTCYTQVEQTGHICAPDAGGVGEGVQITLSPTLGSSTPAPTGTGPAGEAEPLSNPTNNSDPLTCAGNGGNWGVFNGKGTCYSPTKTDPVVTSNEEKKIVTDPITGESVTVTTTTTNTCTAVGSCSSTSITNVSGGAGGGAGTGTTVTSSGGTSASGSGTMTATGNGNYKLDLPKDYQKDSTGLVLNQMVQRLSDTIGKPVADDALITGATNTEASGKALTDQDKLVTDTLNGQENGAITNSVNGWTAAMSSGWLTSIPSSNCAPFSHTFNFFSVSYNWTFDHCPTASKISEIGAYCMWVLLCFSGFRMLTTPRAES